MRQIRIGAWLFMTCSAIAACSGEEFAPSEQSTTNDSTPTGSTSATAGRSSSGGSSNQTAGANQGNAGKSGGYAGAGSPTAGSPGTAGTGSSSGGPGSGGGSNDDCATGTVKFRMLPGPDLPHDYVCNAACGTGWLTITDAAGATAFSIFSACGTASCESCEPLPCVAGACLPTPLTAEGSELTWDGTYLAQGTCGNNMACQRRSCMPAGRYKAKACAAVSAGSSGMGNGCMPNDDVNLCAEAEFDFPTTTEVKLILH